MSTKLIDLGWCIGKLYNNFEALLIVCPAGEDPFEPAVSIKISGGSLLRTLRDALNEWEQPELMRGQADVITRAWLALDPTATEIDPRSLSERILAMREHMDAMQAMLRKEPTE